MRLPRGVILMALATVCCANAETQSGDAAIPPAPQECNPTVLKLSEAIYTKFGNHNCDWFLARDIIIVITWFIAFFTSCSMCYAHSDKYKADVLASFNGTHRPITVFFQWLFSLCLLAVAWEVALPLGCIALWYKIYHEKKDVKNDENTTENRNPAAVSLNGYDRLTKVTPTQVVIDGSKEREITSDPASFNLEKADIIKPIPSTNSAGATAIATAGTRPYRLAPLPPRT